MDTSGDENLYKQGCDSLRHDILYLHKQYLNTCTQNSLFQNYLPNMVTAHAFSTH